MVSPRRGPRPDAAREDEGSGNAGAARGRARKHPRGSDRTPGQGAGRRGGCAQGTRGRTDVVCVCGGAGWGAGRGKLKKRGRGEAGTRRAQGGG